MFTQLLISIAFVLAVCCQSAVAKAPTIGTYNISDVTVSGISAGGYMAVQFHVAYSATVKGAAVFAGGPYYCAEGNLLYAEGKCMDTYLGPPGVDRLIQLTKQDASKKLIDDPSNMADDRIYLFSGKADSVVKQPVMQALMSYYLGFIKATNLVADFDVDAQHCIPTVNYGEACNRLSSPYIGKCNFDGAGYALKTLYGEDLISTGTMIAANLKEFDQTALAPAKASLDDSGYVYVPTACQSGAKACRLHVSFHGCNQDQKSIQNQYAHDTGFNSWAEANDIIVLYPYATSSTMPSNPNSCWDWWAYSGSDYAYKSGKQMKFVKDLITKLGAK